MLVPLGYPARTPSELDYPIPDTPPGGWRKRRIPILNCRWMKTKLSPGASFGTAWRESQLGALSNFEQNSELHCCILISQRAMRPIRGRLLHERRRPQRSFAPNEKAQPSWGLRHFCLLKTRTSEPPWNVYGDVATNEMKQAHSKVVGLELEGAQGQLTSLFWRKRVWVEHTGDRKPAARRFWRPGRSPDRMRFRICAFLPLMPRGLRRPRL